MLLNVQVMRGKAFSCEVEAAEMQIGAVKEQLSAQCGIPAAEIRLVWRGRVVADDETIASAGITEGGKVFLAPKPAAASPSVSPRGIDMEAVRQTGRAASSSSGLITVTLKRVGTTEELVTEIAPTDLVQRLLERAGEAWAVGGVRIVHGGRMVPPSLSLRDAGLEDGMVVHAVSSGAAGAAGAAAAGEHTAGEGAEDSVGPICRICHDGPLDELGPLFSPCQCAGSMRFVHVECLNRWRRMSANPSSYYKCDSCNAIYLISRTRWAERLQSSFAAEMATAVLCILLVALAALPSYLLNAHTEFYKLCHWTPWWHHPEAYWLVQTAHSLLDLDVVSAGVITVSGLFYCGWVLSLFQSGNLERLGHLALTFAAQGTIIFRLLLISGALMACRFMHSRVKLVSARLMQSFGETLRGV